MVTVSRTSTAQTNVHAGGLGPGSEPAASAAAACAAPAAAVIASPAGLPSATSLSRTGVAASTAACEAVSGRLEEDTPSQTEPPSTPWLAPVPHAAPFRTGRAPPSATAAH